MVNNIEKQVEDTVVHTEQARANIKQAVVYKQVRVHYSLIDVSDSFEMEVMLPLSYFSVHSYSLIRQFFNERDVKESKFISESNA